MSQQPSSRGEQWYRNVLGEDPRESPEAPLVGIRALTVDHLFANVWSRSAGSGDIPLPLPLKARRLVTLALLTAQGRNDQLLKHLRGAARSGISQGELIELMIHVAHYAGWSAGSAGQEAVLEVFKDVGPEHRPTEDSDRQHLINLNAQIVAYEQAGNVAELSKVLSEDLIFRRASGAVVTKSSFLNAVPQAAVAVTERQARDVKASVAGDVAVVTLTVGAKVAEQGSATIKEFKNIRFFRRVNGSWLLTCWFNEAIPKTSS